MHDAALKLGQVGHMYIIIKSAFAAQTCEPLMSLFEA